MTSRFCRFGVVGLMGAAVQVAAFHALIHWAGVVPVAAAPLSVELAILHNFFWHDRFTWSDRKPPGRLWRFHVANGLVSIVGNTLLAWWLVEQLHIAAAPAAIVAIAVCAPVNFWVADRWVYNG
jgi:dolichol-phosphate mannosyltransferase